MLKTNKDKVMKTMTHMSVYDDDPLKPQGHARVILKHISCIRVYSEWTRHCQIDDVSIV